MTQIGLETLESRVNGLDKMPSLPIVVGPLMRYLEQPLDQLDLQQVVDLIAQDKSLAAQCLQMANSPLFGHWQAIDSLRGAVVALGLQRMRDIVLSCSVLKLPCAHAQFDPVVFWEHSLACALVGRRLATRIGFPDPGKAYLAGLLHDLGVLVNLWVFPEAFLETLAFARSRQIPLQEAEEQVLGFTHGQSGGLLAARWHLMDDISEVVRYHHDVSQGTVNSQLLAIVALSDLLCRMSAIGYGFSEQRQVILEDHPAFTLLQQQGGGPTGFDWARLTFELDGYLEEVQRLVTALYRPQ